MLKAPANEETLLRKHCFLAAQTGKHLLKKKQNVSEKSRKHFLFLGSKKCFRNKCFLSAQTGKHLGKQQCFRNNVSSFAGAFTCIRLKFLGNLLFLPGFYYLMHLTHNMFLGLL